MVKIRNRHKKYPLNQSPIYKIKNRRKLATIFCVQLKDLERMASESDLNYRIRPKNAIRSREYQIPQRQLRRVHQLLFVLLSRIDPPAYLHSGVKGRSYITNARAHLGATRLIKLDIEKYFPSTRGWQVFEFFHEIMLCSRDVAWLLTTLSTYNDFVPTGSYLSQPIAFYAHYYTFEEIKTLADTLRLTMTCYVDDITISGDKANQETLYKVRGILKKRGLESNSGKECIYNLGCPKAVTGSIIVGEELRLPNRKHKALYEEGKQIFALPDSEEKFKLLEIALGRAVAARQSDPAIERRVHAIKQEKRRLANLFI